MHEHLNEYNKILADLHNLDVDIVDEDKAILLLNSLPDEYDHPIRTLLYEKEEIKFDVVANALIGNEYRRKDNWCTETQLLNYVCKGQVPVKGSLSVQPDRKRFLCLLPQKGH